MLLQDKTPRSHHIHTTTVNGTQDAGDRKRHVSKMNISRARRRRMRSQSRRPSKGRRSTNSQISQSRSQDKSSRAEISLASAGERPGVRKTS